MRKVISFITDIKTIIGLVVVVFTGLSYGYAAMHDKYVKKTELEKIFLRQEVRRAQAIITDLRIEQGYATTEKEQMMFDVLVKVKESQILGMRGE